MFLRSLRPKPPRKQLSLLPLQKEKQILAFGNQIRVDYLDKFSKNFRSEPPESKLYTTWLARVKSAKHKQRKTLGIYDLIELSEYNLGYNFAQLMASFHIWHLDSNSFHVPFGMITPTLFNIAAITGLKPIGIMYSSITLKLKHLEVVPVPGNYSINTFIRDNMRTKGHVEATKHVAFLHCWLTFFFIQSWLTFYVFWSRTM